MNQPAQQGPQNDAYESRSFWLGQAEDYVRGAVGKVEDILPGLVPALTVAARWELFDQRHTAADVKPWKLELLAKDRLQAAWDVGDFYANGSFERAP